jgi:Tripartite tricarboxylate transporter TctB family
MSGDTDNPAPVGGDAGQVLLPAISVRRAEIWIAAVLVVAGVVLGWQASLLDFGTLALPGPGFIPLVLSLATIALGGIIGVREWLRANSGETVELGHRDVLIVFAAMLAVPLLFEPLGAYVTLGLFGAVLLVLVARTSAVTAGVAAVVGMAACWYFFQVALGLQLPFGSVWERLAQVNG